MATDVLTPEFLTRHLQFKAQHASIEKLYHTSRDLLVFALQERAGSWAQNGFIALLKEHERRQFQQKVFALEHPDLHEEFIKIISVVQLVVTAPLPVLSPETSIDPPGYIQSLIAQSQSRKTKGRS
jgi:hypothetical protein